MNELPRRVRELISELRRRKVFRVVSAYCVVAWVVAQVAALAFPAFNLPPWTVTFVLVMAILGLPIAIILSWAYELIPDAGWGSPPPGATMILPLQHAPVRPRLAGAATPPSVPPNTSPPQPMRPTEAPPALPMRPTAFIGREAERTEIHTLLRAEECRLITIVGAGGLGKTRLALEVAREAEGAFADGAFFVELDSLDDVEAVAPTVAEHLGIWLAANADPTVQIVEFLHEKQCLLVFDNFEQLSGATGLVAEILGNAPAVKVIVTSRERLKLHGEAVFALEGLRLQRGSSDTDEEADAVRLFLHGAHLADVHFAPTPEDEQQIARIVELVEGMPLAIELASAWIRVLSCTEIAKEIQNSHDFLSTSLRDVPDRHRSLRAAFGGSWKMLSTVERRAMRRLSVFRGGFTREAAAAVAGTDLATLLTLVDKSLVRRTDGNRFDILVALRQFAEEHLQEDVREQKWTCQSHCDYFAQLLERYTAEQRQTGDQAPLDRIALDLENIRQATHWAIEVQDFDKLAGAVDSMFALLDVRGRAREGNEQFARAIQLIESQTPISEGAQAGRDTVLLKLRARQGAFCFRLGRHSEAQQLLQGAAEQARATNDQRELAFCLEKLAAVAAVTGDYATAQQLSEDSIRISRHLGDSQAMAGALIYRGNAALAQGDGAVAKHCYQESLALRHQGDRSGEWILLCNLGSIAAMQGSHDDANRLFQESLQSVRETKNSRGIASTLMNLGCLAADTGDHEKARDHLLEALAVFQRMGYRGMMGSCLVELGRAEYQLDDSSSAASRFRQALDIGIANEQIPLILSVFVAASSILIADGQHGLAGQLLHTASTHPASDQEIRESARALLEGELSLHPPNAAALEDGGLPPEAEQDFNAIARHLLDRLSLLGTAVRA